MGREILLPPTVTAGYRPIKTLRAKDIEKAISRLKKTAYLQYANFVDLNYNKIGTCSAQAESCTELFKVPGYTKGRSLYRILNLTG